jgi:Mg-chelatase subunit ChlD
MELHSSEMAQFAEAILHAYPSAADLKLLISYELHENIEVVAAGNSLAEKVHSLVVWTISGGKEQVLIDGALKRNPGNPKLKAFVTRYNYLKKPASTSAKSDGMVSHALLGAYLPPVTATLPNIAAIAAPQLPAFAKNAPFHSLQYQIFARNANAFREEIYLSQADAQAKGFSNINFGLLLLQSELPGEPEKQYAVHLKIDAKVPPGKIHVNYHFAEQIGLKQNTSRFWAIKRASQVIPLRKVVLEPDAELDDIEQECESLRQRRDDFFTHRSLFVKKNTDLESLSLYVAEKGYFRLRSIEPDLQTIQSDTLLTFNEQTQLELFVPLRKKAIDMVILVDVSTSMDFPDYVDSNNHVGSRLMGVQKALQVLFERRLAAESRVSNIAILVFSSQIASLFPPKSLSMIEVRQDTRPHIQKSLKMLNPSYLSENIIYRGGTNLVAALHKAMDTFDMCSQEENERLLLLLSDGADWARNTDENKDGEVSGMTNDPVEMAEISHHNSNIRIHTIAISDEQTFKRYITDPRYTNDNKAIPNTRLLRAIAASTRGKYYESPNAKVLTKLFDELGEGVHYQLT